MLSSASESTAVEPVRPQAANLPAMIAAPTTSEISAARPRVALSSTAQSPVIWILPDPVLMSMAAWLLVSVLTLFSATAPEPVSVVTW